MSEPISTSAVCAAVFATLASVAAYVGIDPHALLFGAVGAIIGEPAAQTMGIVRKSLVYMCVVLTAALIATVAAGALHDHQIGWMSIWAFGIAGAFQVLFSAGLLFVEELSAEVRKAVILRIRAKVRKP